MVPEGLQNLLLLTLCEKKYVASRFHLNCEGPLTFAKLNWIAQGVGWIKEFNLK